MKTGDRVTWRYVHCFCRTSRAARIKRGVFIRYCTIRKDMAIVKFDGNKTCSRVLVTSLRPEANQ